MRKQTETGPVFVTLSAIVFALSGVLMKYIPWNPLALNAARSILALIPVGIYLAATRHRLRSNRTVWVGAFAIMVTNVLFCVANKLTTAGNAIILQFTVPIWTMVFSTILLHKKPDRLDLTAAALVLGGVVFFFIDGISEGNLKGNLMALLSGVTYSGVFMMNEGKNGDSASSSFFGMILNALVGLPALMQVPFATATSVTWGAVMALGLLQLGMGYVFLNIGLKTTPAITACLVSGIEPILNPILVALIYGERLTPLSLLGAAIVFLSVLGYNILKLTGRSRSREEGIHE